MGRVKYSDVERDKIISTFIGAAREIIETEGIDKLSIRRVASFTGYSSATIYLYFPNADALITLACMSYLEKYCRAIAEDMDKMQTNLDAHMHTWEVFSRFAFNSPEIFYHLFYTAHSLPLRETVDSYYKLYPHQLDDIQGPVYEMLLGGSLEERCLKVLWPLAQERGISRKDCELMNDLSICYFRKLLERCIHEDCEVEALLADMMNCLEYLLK